jgi:hypothetical protein
MLISSCFLLGAFELTGKISLFAFGPVDEQSQIEISVNALP